VFDSVLGQNPNQLRKLRTDVTVTADQLLDIASTPGEATEAGVRSAVDVGVRYLVSWLNGNGAAAIDNLMEDAATAEISRSQLWQWVHNNVRLTDGHQVTADLVREVLAQTRAALAQQNVARLDEACTLFESVALGDRFVDFLTLPAYELID
jgi:malate synthase